MNARLIVAIACMLSISNGAAAQSVTAPTAAAPAASSRDCRRDEIARTENATRLSRPPDAHADDEAAALEARNRPFDSARWKGPRVDIGYLFYVLSDSWGGGQVNGLSISGYVPTGRLRLGVMADGGVRRYTFGSDDAVVRGTAFVGYQDLGRISHFLPYFTGLLTSGAVIGKRFSTTFTNALFGLGAEIGVEVNPMRTLHGGVAFGGSWMTSGGLRYQVWTFRVFVGL